MATGFNRLKSSKLVGGPATGYKTFPRCCICKRTWGMTVINRAISSARIEQEGKVYRVCGVCLEEQRGQGLIF